MGREEKESSLEVSQGLKDAGYCRPEELLCCSEGKERYGGLLQVWGKMTISGRLFVA